MEQGEIRSGNRIWEAKDVRSGDINEIAALLMEERLQYIQKEINEIISQAVKYQEQGNHIILSGYLAGGIARLNSTITDVLQTVEMIKAMEKQAG